MANDRPNILILFAEQHRGDCLGSADHPVLLTPNIDAIGGAGTRFRNAYSTCPVCVPARRSLISGQFPETHGARANISAEWPIQYTLGSVLRDAGYQTGWIGRSMHQFPVRKRFGFEEVVLADHRCDDDYAEYLARNMPEGGAGYYGSGVMHNDWTARSFHLLEELHHTNWTIHEAQRFLDRRDPSRPFCMVVSFMASHPPLVPPAFYMDRYLRTGVPEPHIGDWAVRDADMGMGAYSESVDLRGEAMLSTRAGYYGLINHLDDQIHRLMNGVLGGVDMKNTIVVYTADHGEMLGDHYRWRKSLPYEGAANIPMLFQCPQRFGFPTGQTSDFPVCLEDLMPTLLDLVEVDKPSTVEGRSLVDVLRGESGGERQIHLLHAAGHHSLTDGQEKYVWFVKDGREQFFRLTDDPNELCNLVNRPEEKERVSFWRQRMIAELRDWPEGFSDGKQLNPGCLFKASAEPKKLG